MENLSMRTLKPKISFFDVNHDTDSDEKSEEKKDNIEAPRKFMLTPKPKISFFEANLNTDSDEKSEDKIETPRRSMRTPKPKISFCEVSHGTPCSKKKTYAQTPKNKIRFSNILDSPKTPQLRNSFMTTGGLFTEDDMDSPLPIRKSVRRSKK